MSKRTLERYQYRQILVRLRQGDTDRQIARARLMGRRKLAVVRVVAHEHGWLDPQAPLPADAELAAVFSASTAAGPVSLAPWCEPIRQWQAAGIQGTTIHAALVREHGYTGSYSTVYRLLRRLAAERGVEVPLRLEFAPGEAAQVDFGAGPLITDVYTGEVFKSGFFVMTLCHSRHQYVELVRDQTVATWLGCHRRAFEWFTGVPGRVIIDNAKCAITRACRYEPEVQRGYAECAEGYGFKIDACPPHDPQKKGIVEAGVKYVKRACLPLRTFRDLADANRQVRDWVLTQAGNRIHGTTRERPFTRFTEVERALLHPLPDVPLVLATWARVKVHRDAHVQFARGYYSVPFRLVGETLWLKATDTTVTLYREHESVAIHVRLLQPGARRTLNDHLPPAALAWKLHDTQWCLKEAERIGPCCLELVTAWFADRVRVRLRAVQGVLRFAPRYGAARLEAACRRALFFGTPSYQAVKTILYKGLDPLPLTPTSPAAPGGLYAEGGRFCRDSKPLLTH